MNSTNTTRNNSGLGLSTVFMSLLLVIVLFQFSSCSIIDDDRDDCEVNLHVRYQVTLKTNLTTQVQTVLRDQRLENAVADLLMDSLKNIFREYANDVDLSFYINHERRYHAKDYMRDNQKVYELTLPADNYRHLALANTEVEQEVDVDGGNQDDRLTLLQEGGDTILGHQTGVFTARQNMNILGNRDQTFDVTLYMANCASILVVNTGYASYRDIRVVSSDFADGFQVNDSVFTHNTNPIVKDYRVTQPPVEREIFYAVTFPSYDSREEVLANPATRATSEETGSSEDERIWRKFVYVTLPDGSITRTVINVRQPLQAGQIMIIYSYMYPDGRIVSPNVEVGTSVTLNWKDGLIIGS